MAEISYFNFLRRLKGGKESFPVTVLYGYNEFLGEKVIESFCRHYLEEKSEFNYRRYYFDMEYADTNWEEVVNEVNTSSFFVQSRKVTVVTVREPKKLTLLKYDATLLQKYLGKPNPNSLLVIYISFSLSRDDYTQVKREKIAKFLEKLKSPNCFTVNMDSISADEVKDYMRWYLQKAGKEITAGALDKIMELKDDDYISILAQLPRFEIVEGDRIDTGDIDMLVTGVEAHSIWDLTDAIESGDTEKYLRVLRYLFMNGVDGTLIIGTLVTHYNKIFVARFLLERRYPVKEIGRAVGQNYYLDKFMRSVRRISDRRLRHVLDLLYRLDYKSKSTSEALSRISLQNFTLQVKAMGKGRE